MPKVGPCETVIQMLDAIRGVSFYEPDRSSTFSLVVNFDRTSSTSIDAMFFAS